MLLQKALPVEPEHSIAAAKSADHLAAHVSLLSQTPCGTLLHTPLLQVRLSDNPLGPFSGNLRFDNKLETIVRPLAQIADIIVNREDERAYKKGHVALFEGAMWPLRYHLLLASVSSCR